MTIRSRWRDARLRRFSLWEPRLGPGAATLIWKLARWGFIGMAAAGTSVVLILLGIGLHVGWLDTAGVCIFLIPAAVGALRIPSLMRRATRAALLHVGADPKDRRLRDVSLPPASDDEFTKWLDNIHKRLASPG